MVKKDTKQKQNTNDSQEVSALRCVFQSPETIPASTQPAGTRWALAWLGEMKCPFKRGHSQLLACPKAR